MKASVVIDDWKRPIFERGLQDAGFTFEIKPFTKDGKTLAIFVDFEQPDFGRLTETVAALQEECRRRKPSQN
jgi:hypothetical protein